MTLDATLYKALWESVPTALKEGLIVKYVDNMPILK